MSDRRTRLLSVLTALVALLALAAPSALARTSGHGVKHRAAAGDRNGDRIPDRWERRHHLSLRVDQARRDQDHDGLRNRAEFQARTDPRDPDTDDDGHEDGQEHAGTVTAFDGTTLVVHLFTGADLSATVDGGTEIECHGAGELEREADAAGDAPARAASDAPDPPGADDQGAAAAPAEGSADGQDGDGEHAVGSGEDGHGDRGGDHGCPAGALQVGVTVHEAELDAGAGAGGATWHKLALVVRPA